MGVEDELGGDASRHTSLASLQASSSMRLIVRSSGC